MISVKELMSRVGRIRIMTSRLIDDQLAGDYHSTFKGQGVEFDEVRPYVAGDDVRTIDWNVTARTGTPFIKRYAEERELTVLFLVDISGSENYGSTIRSKAELAAEITSLLALTAVRNQDKIGLVLFSDKIVKFLPPRKGRQPVMRLVREVLAAGEEAGGGTDIAGALRFMNNVQKRSAVVFIVSDFQDDGFSRELRVTAQHHDVIAVPISDPAERTLPDAGLAELEDPETGELILVDTSSREVRKYFAAAAKEDEEKLSGLFRRSGVDALSITTDKPYINDVRALFARRARKKRRQS